jgi:hypothetical protein
MNLDHLGDELPVKGLTGQPRAAWPLVGRSKRKGVDAGVRKRPPSKGQFKSSGPPGKGKKWGGMKPRYRATTPNPEIRLQSRRLQLVRLAEESVAESPASHCHGRNPWTRAGSTSLLARSS